MLAIRVNEFGWWLNRGIILFVRSNWLNLKTEKENFSKKDLKSTYNLCFNRILNNLFLSVFGFHHWHWHHSELARLSISINLVSKLSLTGIEAKATSLSRKLLNWVCWINGLGMRWHILSFALRLRWILCLRWQRTLFSWHLCMCVLKCIFW